MRDRGCVRRPIQNGIEGTMTWLELLLVVALVLIVLGLAR